MNESKEVLQSSTTQWTIRMHNAKKCAEYAEENDVFFLEVSSSPLVSLFITTGKIVDEETKRRSVSLSFIQHKSLESSSIPINVL